MIRRLFAVIAAGTLVLLAPSLPAWLGVEQARSQMAQGPSGLPLPRFVSLKSSRINVRRGPGQDYDVAFVFVRAGLPVEIVQEFDNWRKIRDSEGEEGWIFHSLLSGQRTAMIAPWAAEGEFPIRRQPAEGAVIAAYLGPRVLADVASCDGEWCKVSGEEFEGWIEQQNLWGVYPRETVED